MNKLTHTVKHHFEIEENGDPLVELIYEEGADTVHIGNESDGFVVVDLAKLISAAQELDLLRHKENS